MTVKLCSVRLLLVACLLTSVLSACAGGKPAPPPAESPAAAAADPADPFVATGEMVNVTPVLDTADAVYALVPQQGGEIHLTLANGLAFTLTIPEGALLSDQEVTLTPIRQIEGLPFSGGLIAGVQLEPDGTSFLKPVTLTIHIPAGYDAEGMVGFGYHGQGEGLYMMPAGGDGTTISMQLLSFSGHGAAVATQADIDAQASAQTTTWYEEYRQRQARGEKTASEQQVEDFRNEQWAWLKQYFEQVKELLKAAAQNEGLVDPALEHYYAWRHDVEWLQLGEEMGDRQQQLDSLMIRALRNSFDRASKGCSEKKDITKLTSMLKRIYTLAWLGDEVYTIENKEPDFERCARFRVVMTSDLKWELETRMEIEGGVTGEAIVRWKQDDPYDGFHMLYEGKGEAKFTKYTIGFSGEAEEIGNKCDVETPEKPGRFYAAGRIYWMNLGTKTPKFSTMIGVYLTGMGQHMNKWNCKTGAQGEGFTLEVPTEMPTWYSGFRKLHESEKLKVMEWEGEYYFPGPLRFNSVQHIGQFSRSYSGSEGPNQVTEDFTLDVFAAPGQ